MADSQSSAQTEWQDLFGSLLNPPGSGDSALAASTPTPPPTPPPPTSQPEGDEFSLLQELLVKPDIASMRQHIAQLEKELPQLQQRLDVVEEMLPELAARQDEIDQTLATIGQAPDQTQLLRVLVPLISQLLDRKLAALEIRLLEQIEGAIAANGHRSPLPPQLSLRVQSLDPDAS